jgi:hypothetical protein
MYPGRRSRDEVALIDRTGDQTTILAIDERPTRDDSHFAVLPGVHKITLGIEAGRVAENSQHYDAWAPPPVTVCFRARKGHTYAVRLDLQGTRSRPQILDREDGGEVQARTIDSPAADCPSDDDGADAASTVAAGEEEQGDAGPAPAPAVYESPAAPPAKRKQPVPRLARAGTGVVMELGAAFGGDDLVTAVFSNGESDTLTAGGGVLLLLGGEWTPFRSRKFHGLGFGLRAGLKYDSVGASNGKISLMRFPVLASVHGLIHFHRGFFALGRVGVEKDFRPVLSGEGDARLSSVTFANRLGVFVESGFYWQTGWDTGFGLSVRYTWMEYGFASAQLDASSVALVGTFHVSL